MPLHGITSEKGGHLTAEGLFGNFGTKKRTGMNRLE